MPQAIIAFLESTDFEDAIRNAISLGGDSDTMAAITGSIAEAAYGIPKAIRDNGGVIDEDRKREIVKELGDVCWFVAELCTCLGVSLEDVMQKNLDKLASRKARGVIHGSGDNR